MTKPVMHDWAEIGGWLQASVEGSRIAREQLRAVLGVDHGNDRVAWHDAARTMLRAEVEGALAALGAFDTSVSALFDRTRIAFFSLSPEQELARAASVIADPTKRAAVEAYAKSLVPRQGIELETIVPADRLWVCDSECVDAADDYIPVVTELLALAKLQPSKVECRETSGRRALAVTIGGKTFVADLRGNTDYIDELPLIACLNEAVVAAHKSRRFQQVVDERWGQELGIALVTAAEVKRLRAAGLLPADAEEDV